jgi:two-component system CheB/CheR fusion protein
VNWSVRESAGKRRLTLTWRERNGPKVDKSAQKGGGGALIDRALPDAKITRNLDPEGLICTVELPLLEGR